ncbi:MAG: FAD-binding protein [Dehalococcoidales bacterium]|nr:FAD-binding protein [Dehalococcoidales bacterium]
MSQLESLGHVIEADILIIGGGIAGLWAACKAREYVNNVVIVEKGPADWGGLASRAGGDLDAVIPEEKIEDWLSDIVYYFDGLCDQEIVKVILENSYARLADYEYLGHKFLRGPDGNLKGILQRGLDHVKCFLYRPYGAGGSNMVRVMQEKANQISVKRFGRIYITDILKTGSTITGAIGFNVRNGDFYIFKANTIILATGSSCLDIALKAGVELKNFEFGHVRNDPKSFLWEGQTNLLPLGAYFVNAKGERFMDKYSPILRNNTDFHYNVIGMAIETRAGNNPFYLDCSEMKPADIELMKPEAGWLKLSYDRLLASGINFFQGKTEWQPRVGGNYGGVIVDTKGRTKVPGLFAAGTTWATNAGVYMGGWNLCKTAVTGYIVGESGGEYAASAKNAQINPYQVETLKRKIYSPLKQNGILPSRVGMAIRDLIQPIEVSILKNKNSLTVALDKMGFIKEKLLPQMTAKDTHHLMNLMDVNWTALSTEFNLTASLMREETRGGHTREDFPKRDNRNWMKWIIFSSDGENHVNVRSERIPLEKYDVKPKRYYMDNFRFT